MKWLMEKLGTRFDNPTFGIKDILKYLGPGLLVTVGFIDPGNWATNMAAGSIYGYNLLWVVTISTIMLILLQHNVAHLGIVTGSCLAESASKHLRPWISRSVLSTAIVASVSTALAEILGGAIALNMLFKVPLKLGAVLILIFVVWMLFTNSYRRLEKIIIGFVSIIGFSFIYELYIVPINWMETAKDSVIVSFPLGSIPIIMAVLGAVVMPHNLFLHSEIIQSRQWNKENADVINKQLKYEFMDTLFSMGIGWAINCAMLILAASVFFANNVKVTELQQAQQMLHPLLGNAASVIFAIALLFAGIASTMTAGIASGTIVAGLFSEPYDINDKHTKLGIASILSLSTIAIFMISDPFKGLLYSQMLLSIQLPITIFLQLYLTSSKRVMGDYKNSFLDNLLLWSIGILVSALNIYLLYFAIFS